MLKEGLHLALLRLVQHLLLLLLEGSSLVRHVERRFALGLALAVVRVSLHHVGHRLTFTTFLRSVLSPSFLLNIKRRYQTFDRYLRSLVFEGCGEVPP